MNDKKKGLRMKMKLMWGALIAIAFASCTQEDVLNNGAGQNTLRASMEETGTKTRVGFTDQTAEFFWTKGDKIGVTTTSSSQTFQGMALVGEGGQATGTFSGTMSAAASGYAVYPYGVQGRHSVSNGVLTYNLPATYEYATLDTEYAKADGNSYNAPMWGSISNGSVAFKHLGGVIAFSVSELPENTENLEFILTATNQICGSFNATLTDGEPKIVAAESNVADAEKKVTITFSTAAGQTSGYFYVPVPTGSLGNLSLVILNGQTEVATGAWDNITIARKDIKRATIGNQSIIGGNGEIKQVTSVSDVNGALNTTEDNLTVRVSGGVPTGDNTIEIPATLGTATTTFSFASVADGAKITIEDEDGGSYDGKIIIEIPEDETLPEVVANIPYGEVYIKQGTVTTLVTSAADNTTIIGAKAKVGTLTVAKGNVRIEEGGAVTKIERAAENTATVYVIYEGTTAPTIETIGEGVVLMSDAEYDLNVALAKGGTVTLEADVTLHNALTVSNDVTLNLNGKTLTGSVEGYLFESNGNLTISNGYITNTGGAVKTTGGTLNMTDCNVTVTGNKRRNAVYITGKTNAVITGGQYTATGTLATGEGTDWYGIGIVDGTVTLNTTVDGTFNGGVTLAPDGTRPNVTITGGSYSGQMYHGLNMNGGDLALNGEMEFSGKGGDIRVYTLTGTINGKNFGDYGNKTYSLDGLVAIIGSITEETTVATPESLVAAVAAGGKVKLGMNMTLNEALNISNDVTLNLNGKTLTGNVEGYLFESNGNLTISNGNITNTGGAVKTTGGTLNMTDCNVAVTGNKRRNAVYITEITEAVITGGCYKATGTLAEGESTDWYGIGIVDGKLTLNTTVEGTFNGGVTLAPNGTRPNVTITGGSYSGQMYHGLNMNGGDLTLKEDAEMEFEGNGGDIRVYTKTGTINGVNFGFTLDGKKNYTLEELKNVIAEKKASAE